MANPLGRCTTEGWSLATGAVQNLARLNERGGPWGKAASRVLAICTLSPLCIVDGLSYGGLGVIKAFSGICYTPGACLCADECVNASVEGCSPEEIREWTWASCVINVENAAHSIFRGATLPIAFLFDPEKTAKHAKAAFPLTCRCCEPNEQFQRLLPDGEDFQGTYVEVPQKG